MLTVHTTGFLLGMIIRRLKAVTIIQFGIPLRGLHRTHIAKGINIPGGRFLRLFQRILLCCERSVHIDNSSLLFSQRRERAREAE